MARDEGPCWGGACLVRRRKMRNLALVLALAASAAGAPVALAHGSAGGVQLPPDAEAVAPEGKKAKELLAALPADAPVRAAIADPVKKAKLALGRAHGAKLAGDEDGARLLSRVALAWAQAARATVQAVQTEKRAADGETRTKTLKEKIARARALLTETEARKLQLTAEVSKAEDASTKPSKNASKDASKPRAGAPKTPPSQKKSAEKARGQASSKAPAPAPDPKSKAPKAAPAPKPAPPPKSAHPKGTKP